MRKYKVISGDGHVEVPIDFSSRVPSKFKDIVPQLVRREDGTEYWKMGEATRENIGNLYCDLTFDKFTPNNTQRYHFNDGSSRPGTGDAVQRLREQDKDGIDAEVLFFPIFGPAFLRKLLPEEQGSLPGVRSGLQHVSGPGVLCGGARPVDRQCDDARMRRR